MFNGNAEAQSFYLVDVRHIFQDGVYHKVCAALRHQTAEGVQVGLVRFYRNPPVRHFRCLGLLCRLLRNTGTGKAISDQWLPADEFRRQCVLRNSQNVLAVHTFRGGSQTEQNLADSTPTASDRLVLRHGGTRPRQYNRRNPHPFSW